MLTHSPSYTQYKFTNFEKKHQSLNAEIPTMTNTQTHCIHTHTHNGKYC